MAGQAEHSRPKPLAGAVIAAGASATLGPPGTDGSGNQISWEGRRLLVGGALDIYAEADVDGDSTFELLQADDAKYEITETPAGQPTTNTVDQAGIFEAGMIEVTEQDRLEVVNAAGVENYILLIGSEVIDV